MDWNPKGDRQGCQFAHGLLELEVPAESWTQCWSQTWSKGDVDIIFWEDGDLRSDESKRRFRRAFLWEYQERAESIPNWAWGVAKMMKLIEPAQIPYWVPTDFDWPCLTQTWKYAMSSLMRDEFEFNAKKAVRGAMQRGQERAKAQRDGEAAKHNAAKASTNADGAAPASSNADGAAPASSNAGGGAAPASSNADGVAPASSTADMGDKAKLDSADEEIIVAGPFIRKSKHNKMKAKEER